MLEINDRDSGYWSIELNGILVGDERIDISSESAIISTGTEEIQGPLDEVAAIWNAITATNNCQIKDTYII